MLPAPADAPPNGASPVRAGSRTGLLPRREQRLASFPEQFAQASVGDNHVPGINSCGVSRIRRADHANVAFWHRHTAGDGDAITRPQVTSPSNFGRPIDSLDEQAVIAGDSHTAPVP